MQLDFVFFSTDFLLFSQLNQHISLDIDTFSENYILIMVDTYIGYMGGETSIQKEQGILSSHLLLPAPVPRAFNCGFTTVLFTVS